MCRNGSLYKVIPFLYVKLSNLPSDKYYTLIYMKKYNSLIFNKMYNLYNIPILYYLNLYSGVYIFFSFQGTYTLSRKIVQNRAVSSLEMLPTVLNIIIFKYFFFYLVCNKVPTRSYRIVCM